MMELVITVIIVLAIGAGHNEYQCHKSKVLLNGKNINRISQDIIRELPADSRTTCSAVPDNMAAVQPESGHTEPGIISSGATERAGENQKGLLF